VLTSTRLAALREWQGQKYPTTQWPAIIDTDTHERLVRLFAARRQQVVRAPAHLLSGSRSAPSTAEGCITVGTRNATRIPMGASSGGNTTGSPDRPPS
jgi:hypothetical protein